MKQYESNVENIIGMYLMMKQLWCVLDICANTCHLLRKFNRKINGKYNGVFSQSGNGT
jgi:hypothetical protein